MFKSMHPKSIVKNVKNVEDDENGVKGNKQKQKGNTPPPISIVMLEKRVEDDKNGVKGNKQKQKGNNRKQKQNGNNRNKRRTKNYNNSNVDKKVENVVNVDEEVVNVDEEVVNVDEEVVNVDENVVNVDENVVNVDENVANVDENVANVDENVANVDEKVDNVDYYGFNNVSFKINDIEYNLYADDDIKEDNLNRSLNKDLEHEKWLSDSFWVEKEETPLESEKPLDNKQPSQLQQSVWVEKEENPLDSKKPLEIPIFKGEPPQTRWVEKEKTPSESEKSWSPEHRFEKEEEYDEYDILNGRHANRLQNEIDEFIKKIGISKKDFISLIREFFVTYDTLIPLYTEMTLNRLYYLICEIIKNNKSHVINVLNLDIHIIYCKNMFTINVYDDNIVSLFKHDPIFITTNKNMYHVHMQLNNFIKNFIIYERKQNQIKYYYENIHVNDSMNYDNNFKFYNSCNYLGFGHKNIIKSIIKLKYNVAISNEKEKVDINYEIQNILTYINKNKYFEFYEINDESDLVEKYKIELYQGWWFGGTNYRMIKYIEKSNKEYCKVSNSLFDLFREL
uniref:Uncharacterized protein n=1 Tax=viral metagenome TaxID=1070528 RepID=A0A6C0H582_9ZZZZ